MQLSEVLSLALQIFGVTFFLKSKNGWYPDTIKYWMFKTINRVSDKDYAKFFRVVAITPPDLVVEFVTPRVSWRNWIIELWSCSYCVSFWAGVALYLLRHNQFVTTFSTLLGISAIIYLIITKFELHADEPDI